MCLKSFSFVYNSDIVLNYIKLWEIPIIQRADFLLR